MGAKKKIFSVGLGGKGLRKSWNRGLEQILQFQITYPQKVVVRVEHFDHFLKKKGGTKTNLQLWGK